MRKFKVGDRVAVTNKLLNLSEKHGICEGDLGTIVGLHPNFSEREYYVSFDAGYKFPVYGSENLPYNEAQALRILQNRTYYMVDYELEFVSHAESTGASALFA